MIERAVHFRSRAELEAARLNLDRTADIPLEKFKRLLGSFALPAHEEELCQLVKAGSRCNQPHRRGWIAQLQDGTVGLIGRICARENFGEDATYSAEVKRVLREQRIDELIGRIRSKLDDLNYHERVTAAKQRQRELAAAIESLRDQWPDSLLGRLRDMVKTGQHAIRIEVRYVERDEHGRERSDWQPSTLGVVFAPDALEPEPARALRRSLADLELALSEAKPDTGQTEPALRRWADALESLDGIENGLDEAFADLALFRQADNLKRLCWLVVSHVEQEAIVRAALELTVGGKVSDAQTHAARVKWHAEIRAANGGRDFRVG